MSKTQKILLTIALAVILVFTYTVKGADLEGLYANIYTINSLYSNNYISITQDDDFDVYGLNLVGPSGIITINSGTIAINSTVDGNNKLNLIITLNGEATVNKDKIANLDNDSIAKMEIIIAQDSKLNIEGTLVIPSIDGNNSITNNGTINISEEGVLEVRKSVTCDNNGTVNVYGTLAIFGEKVTSVGSVNLYESGEIYSYTDLDKEAITVAENEDTYSLKTDTGTYTSTADSEVIIDSAKLYTLSEAESDVTPDATDDTIGDNSTVGDVSTADDTVVEDDETVDETVVEEVSENPTTGDSIIIFAVIFIVAILGLAVALIAKRKMK